MQLISFSDILLCIEAFKLRERLSLSFAPLYRCPLQGIYSISFKMCSLRKGKILEQLSSFFHSRGPWGHYCRANPSWLPTMLKEEENRPHSYPYPFTTPRRTWYLCCYSSIRLPNRDDVPTKWGYSCITFGHSNYAQNSNSSCSSCQCSCGHSNCSHHYDSCNSYSGD